MERYITGSVEFIPVTVRRNGTPVTDFEICVVPSGSRPAVFLEPDQMGSERGFLIPASMNTGTYTIFAMVMGAEPEFPILKVGSFKVADY